jgi:hypothetical protein
MFRIGDRVTHDWYPERGVGIIKTLYPPTLRARIYWSHYKGGHHDTHHCDNLKLIGSRLNEEQIKSLREDV